MNKLLKQLEDVQYKKTSHYFKCGECQKAHINIDVNDYCYDYKELMYNEIVLHRLIDGYKIDID